MPSESLSVLPPLSRMAHAVLIHFTRDLSVDDDRTFAREPYRPLVVERVDTYMFSLAHYLEREGDLVPDPEVVFVRDGDTSYAVSMGTCGREYVGAELEERSGQRPRVVRRETHHRAITDFANAWLEQLASQHAAPRGGQLPEGVEK